MLLSVPPFISVVAVAVAAAVVVVVVFVVVFSLTPQVTCNS